MDNFSAIESIFLIALEKGGSEERAAYLDEACGANVELRRCMERLLSAHAKVGSFLQAGVPGLAATVDEPPVVERPGSVIGPYKLMEQIGEGGMGLVFVAEQQQPVRRKVALKVIKPGMDSRDVIARFEAERQALALMDHPNIAKVFDAGTTESGRPYFVMELVKGIPITDYCDQNQLTPRQRLELFTAVCQAVQHAHTKGIIHRDLKPSNILVAPHDGTPVVKVIDFGVAKAIGQQLTDKTIYTRFAQMIGTPLYMSPEQAEINALDVDTRSDVYALGVLLYELLTGTTPFDEQRLRKAAFDEMRRIIREEEPPRPSTRLSTLGATLSAVSAKRKTGPRELSALVQGDLDWIVMKALEKDRGRRYETPSAFAADVRRFLSEEPVEARPPSAWYRFRKLARRNKVALTTAALVAAALVLGTAVSTWQAVRARWAEAEATRQRDAAQVSEQETNKAKLETEKERTDVFQAKVRAINLAEKLRQALYVSEMKLAQDAWNQGETRRVLELLNRYRPKPEKRDLRNFEWYFLRRLCLGAQLTLPHQGMWVGFSPDGNRIASVDNGSRVKVWDAISGSEVFTVHWPTPHRPQGAGGAFSPDGKLLAVTIVNPAKDGKGEVKVLEAATGKEAATLKGHTGSVLSIAFSPDSKRLASAGQDAKVRIWDVTTGKELRALPGYSGGHTCVIFSPDGQRVAVGESTSHDVKVWDATTGKEVYTAERTAGTTSLAFSPDGKLLAAVNYRGMVVVMEAATGVKLLSFRAHNGWIYGVAFSPDSKWFATASGFGEDGVKIWDTTGELVRVLRGQVGGVHSVAFSPDGRRLATASDTVQVWDVTTDQEAFTIAKGAHGPIWRMDFRPDGSQLATTGWGPAPKLRDTRTWKEAPELRGPKGEVYDGTAYGDVIDLAFSGDGQQLAGAVRFHNAKDEDNVIEVRIWDTATRRQLRALRGLTHWVSAMAFSLDGRRIAAVSPSKRADEAMVKIWEVGTGQEVLSRTLPARQGGGLAFSPVGHRLASAVWTYDKKREEGRHEVKLWDLATGEAGLTMTGHASDIPRIVFSADGNQLATASADGTLRIWDTGDGEEFLTARSHASSHDLGGVTFSPDAQRLAIASGIHNLSDLPGEVRIFDLDTGRETLTLAGHKSRIYSLAFSPDGHRLASSDRDGVIKIWDATPVPDSP